MVDHTETLGLTDTQLAYIDHVTDQAAKRGAKRALRTYVKRTVAAWVILFAALGFVWSQDNRHDTDQRNNIVTSGDAVAVAGCNRDYHNIDVARDQLELSIFRFDQLEADGTYSKRQADLGRAGTKEFLDRYNLPDCRKADDILTTDHPVVSQTPRYPNDPQQLASERAEAKKYGRPVNGD